jgi:hypothetical protein
MDRVNFEGHSNNINTHTIELLQPVKVGNLFGGVIMFKNLGFDREEIERLHGRE